MEWIRVWPERTAFSVSSSLQAPEKFPLTLIVNGVEPNSMSLRGPHSSLVDGRRMDSRLTLAVMKDGAKIWGMGMALHEETLIDHKFGRIMNANIAEYHVPVNADMSKTSRCFVDEPDEIINPLGLKGLGEIRLIGVAAANANAIYHATGERVRDLPITLDKLQR
jgi:xanthine dehydrogenase YagR molybdenum-binding subunit